MAEEKMKTTVLGFRSIVRVSAPVPGCVDRISADHEVPITLEVTVMGMLLVGQQTGFRVWVFQFESTKPYVGTAIPKW
jgi:hypothetical protein